MTTLERYNGIQTMMGELFDSGCHFLVLLSIAEEESGAQIDLIEAIRISQSKGWMRSDFYVVDALSILRFYTHKEWVREEVKKLPKDILDNQYTEVVYFNKRTSFKHYRRRAFDTLENSTTVREGYVLNYYIYTCRR